MTIINNSVHTLSDLQPDSLRGQASQESQSGGFQSQLAQEVGEFQG